MLFLSALSLTTSGLMASLGVGIGIAASVAFGVYFVRGSLRIDLGRFFKITGIALAIFVLQLLINGYHELSEAGWVPANETTMATVGPLVRNEFFFIAAVLLLPLLMLMIPGRKAEPAAAVFGGVPADGAASRLARAQAERQARARVVGAGLGVVILAALGFGFVYSQAPVALSPATPVTVVDGAVRIPLSSFEGGKLRRFQVTIEGVGVRFIAVPIDEKATEIATAFDACDICGAKGYFQDGTSITCLHCHSAIYPPSIGQRGGCNPAPLPARRVGGDLVIAASDLAAGAPRFAEAGGHMGHGG